MSVLVKPLKYNVPVLLWDEYRSFQHQKNNEWKTKCALKKFKLFFYYYYFF